MFNMYFFKQDHTHISRRTVKNILSVYYYNTVKNTNFISHSKQYVCLPMVFFGVHAYFSILL